MEVVNDVSGEKVGFVEHMPVQYALAYVYCKQVGKLEGLFDIVSSEKRVTKKLDELSEFYELLPFERTSPDTLSCGNWRGFSSCTGRASVAISNPFPIWTKVAKTVPA